MTKKYTIAFKPGYISAAAKSASLHKREPILTDKGVTFYKKVPLADGIPERITLERDEERVVSEDIYNILREYKLIETEEERAERLSKINEVEELLKESKEFRDNQGNIIKQPKKPPRKELANLYDDVFTLIKVEE